MTFEAFLKAVDTRNPGLFQQDRILIQPDTLKALLRQAYDAGQVSDEKDVPFGAFGFASISK